MYYHYLQTPIGPFLLVGTEAGLFMTSFTTGHQHRRPETDWKQERRPLEFATTQLEEYFAGDRTEFDMPLEIRGTPFQRQVWTALQTIPFGESRSYGHIAKEIGRPNASRAVGAANGANILPIIVPCHRVIGSTGSLTGFGGGLDTKRWLLEFEGALPPEQSQLFD